MIAKEKRGKDQNHCLGWWTNLNRELSHWDCGSVSGDFSILHKLIIFAFGFSSASPRDRNSWLD